MQTAKFSKVALVTLALAATACAPAVNVPPVGSPAPASPGATATATPGAPGTTPTPVATGAPIGTATPTAGPNQGEVNPATAKLVVLSGTIYDEAGATVDGARVTVKSLDGKTNYSATAVSAQGSYVVNNVPEGVNVEIIATKDSFTSRKRVGSFQADATSKNEVNFGSTLAASTDAGAAYFISKYPEVAATEPAYNATNVEAGTVKYTLKLSEALDDTNKRRFEDAIRLMPANALANPGGGVPVDLTDLNDPNNDYDLTTVTGGGNSGNASFPYWVKKGSLFLNESATRATVTWNADNTEATLEFKAPLSANRTDVAKYQVALAAPSGTDRIVDKDNNQLGQDRAGTFTSYPPAGNLIRNAFVPINLSLSGNPPNGAARWAATHKSASVYTVKQDTSDPKLVSVLYAKNLGTNSRFELTFDEPMAAFNASAAGRLDGNITNGNVLDTISLAISDRSAGTKNISLKGSTGLPAFNPVNTATYGTASTEIEREFRLDKAAFTGVARSALVAGADTGKLTIEVDPRNPNTLFIYVFNRANVFDAKITDLKARVEGVSDPAGNSVKSANADQNQITGTL